jgi:hypothetical protein
MNEELEAGVRTLDEVVAGSSSPRVPGPQPYAAANGHPQIDLSDWRWGDRGSEKASIRWDSPNGDWDGIDEWKRSRLSENGKQNKRLVAKLGRGISRLFS